MRELVDEGGKASPPATPTTEPPPRRKQTLHEKFVGLLWLCCGFYRAPSNATLRLLVTYASAASCLVVISRYLGRYSEVDTIEVVLLQLWAAAFGVGILKLTGKDPTPWALEHGFNEMISWAFLATGFAVQLIASIRTLSSPHITEWYLLLHYLTPCVVPFFEPRPVTDGVDSKRLPFDLLAFPTLTFACAAVWAYMSTGTIGPGTWPGFWWSLIWTLARIGSLIGTRLVILEFSTPVYTRLLFQTGMAATILTIVRQVAPEVTAQFPDQVVQMDELQDHRDDDMLESHQVWGFLILGCLCGPIATFSRLSLLETTSASSFAVFTSVALSGFRL